MSGSNPVSGPSVPAPSDPPRGEKRPYPHETPEKALELFFRITGVQKPTEGVLAEPYNRSYRRGMDTPCLNSAVSKLVLERLNPRPEEGRVRVGIGGEREASADDVGQILAQMEPEALLSYASSHPEIIKGYEPLFIDACEALIREYEDGRKDAFRPNFFNIKDLGILGFRQVLIGYKTAAECIRCFLDLKDSRALAWVLDNHPEWKALSPEDKIAFVKSLSLAPLTEYKDDEIVHLLGSWEEGSRAALAERVKFLNPEAYSKTPFASTDTDFHELERTLAEAEGASSRESLRVLNTAHSRDYLGLNVEKNKVLYQRAFARGRAQALWGIRHDQGWEEVIIALAIRRRRLAEGQGNASIPFGKIRKDSGYTPLKTEDSYQDFYTPACQVHAASRGEISYEFKGVTYPLTTLSPSLLIHSSPPSFVRKPPGFMAWNHWPPPPGGWLTSPLMSEKFYGLCEAAKNPSSTPSHEAVLDSLAEAHWLYSHMMPFARGSPTVMEMLAEALMIHRGIAPPKGQNYDCTALVTPDVGSYKTWYKKIISQSSKARELVNARLGIDPSTILPEAKFFKELSELAPERLDDLLDPATLIRYLKYQIEKAPKEADLSPYLDPENLSRLGVTSSHQKLYKAVAEKSPQTVLHYVASHPEAKFTHEAAVVAACDRFVEVEREERAWRHRHPDYTRPDLLDSDMFIQPIILHKRLKNYLQLFLEFKCSRGLEAALKGEDWTSLSTAEKEREIKTLSLEALTTYSDDELRRLVQNWEPLTREALFRRVSFLNPEAFPTLEGLGLSEEVAMEFESFKRGLASAGSGAEREREVEGGAAFDEYGSQSLYQLVRRQGVAHAQWGLERGKPVEDVILALAIKRRQLSERQQPEFQDAIDLNPFGKIRRNLADTPINEKYALYVAPARECSKKEGGVISCLDEKGAAPIALTQITLYDRNPSLLAWVHPDPGLSGWLSHPLMKRIELRLDEIREPGELTDQKAIDALAEAHWLFSHLMPFERGSAMIMEMLAAAVLKNRHIAYRELPAGEMYSCQALVTPTVEQYQGWYRGLYFPS